MFKYGLLGNVVTYGGITAVFGYIAYEMNQIAERSPHISEELAREVLDPAKAPKISLDQKEDMRKIASKLYQEDYQRKKHEPKENVEIVEQVQKKQQTTNKDSYIYLYFGTLPSSIPPVFDTTPCMKQMLDYEDCVFESNAKQLEIVHPSWPSIWPRMLTDGKIIDFNNTPMHQDSASNYAYMRPLTKKIKHYLWECEEERFVYKACLRTLISLKKTDRHTSWDTAPVSNITLT